LSAWHKDSPNVVDLAIKRKKQGEIPVMINNFNLFFSLQKRTKEKDKQKNNIYINK